MPETATGGELLNAALRYAGMGFPVIPLHSPNGRACDCRDGNSCKSASKHPWTKNGLKDASTNELTIRRWWKERPLANIGLVIPEGYVVVDVDGQDGIEALEKGEYPLVQTAIQQTGKGWHYVYATKETIRPTVRVLPSVDLRGPDSYIVAAPSTHASGKRYEWATDFELENIAQAAPWIGDLARRGASLGDKSEPVDIAAVLMGVPEGRRDVELFRIACKLRSVDVPMDVAIDLLLRAAARCEPPFEADTAREKVTWAYNRYPVNVDRRMLPSETTLMADNAVMIEFPQARLIFTDMEKAGRELQAEMEVSCLMPASDTEPYVQRINLLSMSARDACRRELDIIYGKEVGWTVLLNRAVSKAQQAYLSIDRSVSPNDIPKVTSMGWLIQDFAPAEGVSILFGAGSGLKTMCAYSLALCMAYGRPWLGRYVKRMRPMVIDYETGPNNFQRRLRRLAAGMGLDPGELGEVRYWNADGIPLADQADAIKRCCDKYNVQVLLVDHLAIACGGDPKEAMMATQYYRTVGRIGRPQIALAHVTGNAEYDPSQAFRPFGSIYWSNGARQTWYMLRKQGQGLEGDVATVGFYKRKVNEGRPPEDFGGLVKFEDPDGPIIFMPAKAVTVDAATPGVLQDAIEPSYELEEDAVIAPENLPDNLEEKRYDDVLPF
jgi:hypothetical protein